MYDIYHVVILLYHMSFGQTKFKNRTSYYRIPVNSKKFLRM